MNDPLDFGATIAALEEKNKKRQSLINNMRTWNEWATTVRSHRTEDNFKVTMGNREMWFRDPQGKMRDIMLEVLGEAITSSYAKLEEIDKEPVE